MKGKLFIGALAVSAIGLAANAATVTDDFSGATLNPMWQVNDNANSYNTGGGAGPNGAGQYVISNTYVEGASNISTSMGVIGANDTARVDGNLRTDQFNTGRWRNQVAIWFSNENWIGVGVAAENGKNGYAWQGTVNGDPWSMDGQFNVAYDPNNNYIDMRWRYVIAGVELTPTTINFYGSPMPLASSDYTGVTDIDANVTLIGSIARPASFVGQAYAIVGKGWTYSNNADPYLNMNNSAIVLDAPNLIDYVRIITPAAVPEPATLGLLAVVGLPMLMKRGRRA